jgi:hypothetical protein
MDHVIPLNERHLRRLGRQYLAYYHENRTHIALGKTTPVSRPIEPRPTRTSLLQSHLASAAFITATVGQKQLDGETTTTHLVGCPSEMIRRIGASYGRRWPNNPFSRSPQSKGSI